MMIASPMSPAFEFQSAPPAKGAIPRVRARPKQKKFQSAPPAKGAILDNLYYECPHCGFNPRPPRRGRSAKATRSSGTVSFNPRPPRRGR